MLASGANVLIDLATIIKDSPGNTHLNFVIKDTSLSTDPLELSSKLPGVKVNRQLVDFVKQHEGMKITM